MDSVVVVGLVVLGIFILPFVLIQVRNITSHKRFIRGFYSRAEQLNLNITEKEQWNSSYCIGIDPNSKSLLYMKKHGGEIEEVIIDLTMMESCRVVSRSRNVDGIIVIDAIYLTLPFQNSKTPEEQLEFFNGNYHSFSSSDLPLAEKWAALVKSSIKLKV